MTYDFCVIGGGIVGLATAHALLERNSGARLVLLEKEQALGTHQTGHNSGVIHAGIYYAPGSLKARLCREGAARTKAFAHENNIAFEQCGKLVVATNPLELERLHSLEERAGENGIAVERLDAAALGAREPNVTGLGALLVKDTGVIDYKRVCAALAQKLTERGAEIMLCTAVTAIAENEQSVTVSAGDLQWTAKQLIVCGGLQADRLARMAGIPIRHRIIPFRGEYYALPPERSGLVKHLIYPVPDPDLPFLGVHLTRMIDGSITVGPNAVLGFAREGYRRMSVSPRDIGDFARFPGFWKMAFKNWRSGLAEMHRSMSRAAYLEECRKYAPGLTLADLRPYPAGIRAQAVSEDGALVHDFLFEQTERMLHVCNAPSPAATSALPIGDMIADQLLGHDKGIAA
jgi:L-2-hydroxyglutarate oxidase